MSQRSKGWCRRRASTVSLDVAVDPGRAACSMTCVLLQARRPARRRSRAMTSSARTPARSAGRVVHHRDDATTLPSSTAMRDADAAEAFARRAVLAPPRRRSNSGRSRRACRAMPAKNGVIDVLVAAWRSAAAKQLRGRDQHVGGQVAPAVGLVFGAALRSRALSLPSTLSSTLSDSSRPTLIVGVEARRACVSPATARSPRFTCSM